MFLSKRIYTISSIGLLLLSLIWIFISSTPAAPQTAVTLSQPRKGFYAPDFELTTLTGETVRLSALRGKPVILNFWASWCIPCQAEMPALQKVYAEYKDQGLQVVAVNMTFQDQQDQAAAFVDKNGLTFPIPLDMKGDAGRSYLIQALPSSFFIGSNGIIIDTIIGGPIDEAVFRSQAEFLMKEAN
jgi:peroxiredoxin